LASRSARERRRRQDSAPVAEKPNTLLILPTLNEQPPVPHRDCSVAFFLRVGAGHIQIPLIDVERGAAAPEQMGSDGIVEIVQIADVDEAAVIPVHRLRRDRRLGFCLNSALPRGRWAHAEENDSTTASAPPTAADGHVRPLAASTAW